MENLFSIYNKANQRLKISFILILIVINFTSSYDFIEPTCQDSAGQQSPVHILLNQTKFYQEKYFRLLNTNYSYLNTTWQHFSNEKAIGFAGEGTVLFLKDWSMFRFNLTKVLFRSDSEHVVDGRYYNLEMQLVHELDDTYITNGRYLQAGVNKLVIHLFFTESFENETYSQFFNYTNFDGWSEVNYAANNKVFFKRVLKLKQIVQNTPSYFYEGGISYPPCEQAWHVISPKFFGIRTEDLNRIKTAILRAGYTNNSTTLDNARNLHPLGVTVYRNYEDVTLFKTVLSYLNYNTSKNIQISLILVSLMISAILIPN